MTGFEPHTSGVRSDCSAIWATTTVLKCYYAFIILIFGAFGTLISTWHLDPILLYVFLYRIAPWVVPMPTTWTVQTGNTDEPDFISRCDDVISSNNILYDLYFPFWAFIWFLLVMLPGFELWFSNLKMGKATTLPTQWLNWAWLLPV